MKYFSGTGTYTKTIQAPADWFQAGAKLWLDLGDVKNIAVVTVNGKPLGTYWKAPFRVDVTSALKPGANTLEIKVINLWVNRLIGDQQEGVTTKYTYTAQQFYRADSPLLPSGLIGPVQVVRVGQQVAPSGAAPGAAPPEKDMSRASWSILVIAWLIGAALSSACDGSTSVPSTRTRRRRSSNGSRICWAA